MHSCSDHRRTTQMKQVSFTARSQCFKLYSREFQVLEDSNSYSIRTGFCGQIIYGSTAAHFTLGNLHINIFRCKKSYRLQFYLFKPGFPKFILPQNFIFIQYLLFLFQNIIVQAIQNTILILLHEIVLERLVE